jgi:acetyl coenzyme A synthetase (ADP forming)-like protein
VSNQTDEREATGDERSERPSSHEADVLLADGTTAHVRDILPTDSDELVAFHARLSPESILFRYFGPHPVLSGREVEHFTSVDGVNRVALIAERGGQMVAVARYDRTPGSDEAEVAFLVHDAFQGKGIGTMLLEHLADAARAHGIRRFVADTLSDNHKMLAVLRDAGFARQYERTSEVMRVVLDIAPSAEALAASEERDRKAVVRSMGRLLRPSSIAVVGAAREHGTIGHQLLRNLLSGGFEGPVYPVNPSASHVGSVPCWPGVEAIDGPVDLALIAVPAARVSAVVEECGRKGVGALVVISAGFAEAGEAGAQMQSEIVRLAHAFGMRIVGPNCFGVVNTDPEVSMNATFAPTSPVRGPLGFVSQSGGLGIALLREVTTRGLGLSSFVSTGNKADISGNDLLRWWEEDPATSVALVYLESFGNPRKFSRIARRFSRTKPIVAVKSGRSTAGTRGAASHTAALASPEDAVDALFRQTGVIRVDTIEELFDTAEVLASGTLPRGPRVAIVTNAGGPGVLAADACVSNGLEVPELSRRLQESLAGLLPAGAGLANPVDMIASASAGTYRSVLGQMLESDEVDAVMVIFTPPLVTRADDVAEAVRKDVAEASRAGNEKPVVACFLGADDVLDLIGGDGASVPTFTYPETAARALARAVSYSRWRERPAGTEPLLEGVDANQARRVIEEAPLSMKTVAVAGTQRVHAGRWVTGERAMSLLESYGIPTAPTIAVASAREAIDAAASVGYPVALKAMGASIVHKTDVGGVRLGIESADDIGAAYEEMNKTLGESMQGAVVQKMAGAGVETICGFVRDPSFGPLVLFGLGGTAVELLGDHATRLAPLTDLDARELVLSIKGSALLTGFRGSEPVDVDSLVDIVLRLGRLAEDLPELTEGDCNPVIATSKGALVVDARFRAHHSRASLEVDSNSL